VTPVLKEKRERNDLLSDWEGSGSPPSLSDRGVFRRLQIVLEVGAAFAQRPHQ